MSSFEIPETIKNVVARALERKEWRSSAERDALAYLKRPTPEKRAAVKKYVREQYDSAGAGYSGRWQ